MKEFGPFLVPLAILVFMWLLLLRPARKQQQKAASLQRELQVGDKVVMSAGIYATVRAVGETTVSLEIAPGTVVEAARQVVVRKAPDAPIDHADTDRPELGN